jgi:hypothetical protein
LHGPARAHHRIAIGRPPSLITLAMGRIALSFLAVGCGTMYRARTATSAPANNSSSQCRPLPSQLQCRHVTRRPSRPPRLPPLCQLLYRPPCSALRTGKSSMVSATISRTITQEPGRIAGLLARTRRQKCSALTRKPQAVLFSQTTCLGIFGSGITTARLKGAMCGAEARAIRSMCLGD